MTQRKLLTTNCVDEKLRTIADEKLRSIIDEKLIETSAYCNEIIRCF